MIAIGKQWHVNHVVDDYRATSDWYRRVFGAVDVFCDEWLEAEKRWASMLTIADLAVDVMEPTAEGEHLPLGKFLARFGNHFHASAYFVDCAPTEIYDALTAQGVRCFGLAGAGREAMVGQPMSPVFTHPRDTAGQMEFMPFVKTKPGPLGVPGRWEDPRFTDGWSVDAWRMHPLAIAGWRVGVVVGDLDRAVNVYHALGAEIVGTDERPDASTRRLLLGANTAIELIRPSTDDTLAGRDLIDNGEIIHSCIFATTDLASAEAHLKEHDVLIAERADGRFTTDPSTCHGAVFEFVDADG